MHPGPSGNSRRIRRGPVPEPSLASGGIYALGGEAAHGVQGRNDQGKISPPDITTSFPQPIGLSATWDPDLLKEAGKAVGRENLGIEGLIRGILSPVDGEKPAQAQLHPRGQGDFIQVDHEKGLVLVPGKVQLVPAVG